MLDWKQYSTSALYSIQASLEAEIKRRTEHGDIPAEFKCDVCHREIEGDSYEFDECAKACDICYNTSDKVRKDVADWKRWQLEYQSKRTDELTKELGGKRRLMEYYRNSDPDKFRKHSARVEEIERELDEIGI